MLFIYDLVSVVIILYIKKVDQVQRVEIVNSRLKIIVLRGAWFKSELGTTNWLKKQYYQYPLFFLVLNNEMISNFEFHSHGTNDKTGICKSIYSNISYSAHNRRFIA